ncbi:MAG: hypothetical protein IJ821_07535 [Lachnospiraceae bacterium]|nr:hypothetical protein [Lachnospiraceae bacterium]
MTLLLTVFAAVVCTIVWYSKAPDDSMQLGTLSLMFWGASIMWLVDAIVEYSEVGAGFFIQSGADMLNDMYLGLSVIALGLVIWLAILFIKDPRGVIKKTLLKNN